MNKSHLISAACVLLLAGCAHLDKECRQCVLDGFDPRTVRQPQPLLPNIFITETEKIVLDQSPIRINKQHVRDGRVTISWALPAGSPYTFPENAIQLGPVPTKETPRARDKAVYCDKGAASQQRASPSVPPYFQITGVELGRGLETGIPDKLQCSVRGDRAKVFDCSYTAPKRPTIYKYSVYVCRGSELLQPYDPFVVNDI